MLRVARLVSRSNHTCYQRKNITYCSLAGANQSSSSQSNGNVHSYIQSGLSYFKYNQWDRAMENFTKVLDSSEKELNQSEKILAYRFRGKLHCAKHDYEKAIEDMSKIIEIEPNSCTAYVERGETFYKQQQYDRAIKDYTRAIELIEKQAKNKQKEEELNNILIKRGNAYRFNNQLEEAIADFSRAIELCPNDIRAYESRAMLYSKLGQKEKAIDDYRKVLEIDPKKFIAIHSLKSLLKNEKGISEYSTL